MCTVLKNYKIKYKLEHKNLSCSGLQDLEVTLKVEMHGLLLGYFACTSLLAKGILPPADKFTLKIT